MNEARMQALFTRWLKTNEHYTFAYELKCIKEPKKRLYFSSDVRPQQIPALHRTKYGWIHKKLSDLDPSTKPWDGFKIANAPAYLIILYYSPRKPKTLYWLEPEILMMLLHLDIKSISEREARQLSAKITQL